MTEKKFDHGTFEWARNYWRHLTDDDLKAFQAHYTTGPGKGLFTGVYEGMSFEEYVIVTALQSEYETIHDL